MLRNVIATLVFLAPSIGLARRRRQQRAAMIAQCTTLRLAVPGVSSGRSFRKCRKQEKTMRSFLVSVTALLALAFTSEHALAVAIALGRGLQQAQIDGICTREGGRSYTDGENYGVRQTGMRQEPALQLTQQLLLRSMHRGKMRRRHASPQIFPPGAERYRGDLGLTAEQWRKNRERPQPPTPGVPAAGTPDGGPGFSSCGPSDAGMAVGGGSVTGPGTAAGPLR